MLIELINAARIAERRRNRSMRVQTQNAIISARILMCVNFYISRRDLILPVLAGETDMITRHFLAALAAASLVTAPAFAQTTSKEDEKSGHHYQGGPKTEVPHHMGKKETTGKATTGKSGGHHYTGGPATSTPHHMGEKQ